MKKFQALGFVLIALVSFQSRAAEYNRGLEYAQKGDYFTAAAIWEKLVNNGLSGATKAAYSLGSLYMDGLGVNQDQMKALDYYRLSALMDYQPGQFRTGILSMSVGANTNSEYLLENGFMWLIIAARRGYPQAAQFLPQYQQMIPNEIQQKAEADATGCLLNFPQNCF